VVIVRTVTTVAVLIPDVTRGNSTDAFIVRTVTTVAVLMPAVTRGNSTDAVIVRTSCTCFGTESYRSR